MEKRIAIVDLGTNTFHLMIVDINKSGYWIVHRDRKAVKIGMGGINRGLITNEALERALDAIGEFKNTIDQFKVKTIFAYGTSALRNAHNQEEVVNQIGLKTGVKVSVISGEEEARLIYLGVRSALNLGNTQSLIMDIGGGSVEFIIGNESEIKWKLSVEIGAQRLLEKFNRHDPIAPDEINDLYQHFDQALGELFNALKEYHPDTLVGSSGTFDTLSDIFCLQKGMEKDSAAPETPLSFEGFELIFNDLLKKNRKQRMAIPGMIELRVDMIVVACCLIDYVLKKYSFSKIRVSSYALKEGALADILKRHPQK